ncbi:MAG TPA: GHMP kinase, partial [Planctomycetota bacterium]|nr:GHMP kinase [Planctomycetota bacterium]
MPRYVATTPTRIDLAGGTIDLYPLSAFMGGTLTVNLAIDIACRAEVTTRDDGRFRLRSEDGGASLELGSRAELDGFRGGSPLDLLVEALQFWGPATGLDVTTRNLAPRGSGLGASSALLIALLGALGKLGGREPWRDGRELCQWAAAIEAKHIQVPTGLQDYYAAVFGGPLAIEFGLAGPRPAPIEPAGGFLEWFEASVQVFFTGEPHFSGAPNWAVLKRYVDGDAGTRECLRAIAAIAPRMREAVAKGDRDAFTELLGAEWEARKRLAEGVTTPRLERIIAAARGAGALAAKACGAGGGGCLVVVAPEGRGEPVAAAAAGEG